MLDAEGPGGQAGGLLVGIHSMADRAETRIEGVNE